MPVTIRDTATRTLTTDADVAAYISERLAAPGPGGLKRDDIVKIAAYAGRPDSLGAGDIGVVVASTALSAKFTKVACLSAGGGLMVVDVPTAALAVTAPAKA